MAPNPPVSVLTLLAPSRSPLPGMGAIASPDGHGVTFRVWAPFAGTVAVAGTFNHWSHFLHPLAPETEGMWAVHVDNARPGHRYQFVIRHGSEEQIKTDPYVREVDPITLHGIIHGAGPQGVPAWMTEAAAA